MNFRSKYLRGNTEVSVILPDLPRGVGPREFYLSGKRFKVLWLFHGTFGDHTDWCRYSNIERYACEQELIVVMPSVLNTNYNNWPGFGTGYYLYEFIAEELMPLVQGWFPASAEREDNYTAGLSMGAWGALKLLMDYPERFAAGAMLSGIPSRRTDLEKQVEAVLGQDRETLEERAFISANPFSSDFAAFRLFNDVRNAGSPEAYLEASDFWGRLKTMVSHPNRPEMYFACGERDPFYPTFKALEEYAEDIGLTARFESGTGGHDWEFWDTMIQKALQFFDMVGIHT